MQKKTIYYELDDLNEFMYLNHENTDLYLEHCGIQHCPPGHTYSLPRSEYHVHFVLDGLGTLNYHNKQYHLKRGDIFVIPPRSTYVYQADYQTPWSYAWIGFNGTKARQYLNQSGIDSQHVIRPAYIDPEKYINIIKAILAANQLTVANEIYRLGCLYDIISLMMESNRSIQLHPKNEYSSAIYIEQALAYIEDNYQQNIKVNDIVSYLYINRSYFSSIFKQEMQVSPLAYLQSYRIKKAKNLLSKTNMTLHEIALNIGYKDAFTFSKVFKKTTGVSPSKYRDTL
ncbi:MAG: AraC family transcriptional regulator [Mobilitalea sp.]